MNPFSASKSDFPTNFLFFPIYSDDGSICHKECEENIRNSGNNIKQRKYSLEEYQKAMELLRRHGLRKVSKILGIPVSTLRDWRKGKHKPPLMRWTPKPCPELAYIIGCLLSDAWVYATDNGDYRICLETKDKDYAENFNRCMAKVLNKKPRRIYLRKKRKYWFLYYESVAFSTWWKNQNLASLKPFIEHCEECTKAFLRGFMDGDGSNSNYHVCAVNANIELLKYIKHLLAKLSIKTGRIRVHNRAGTKVKIQGREIIRKKDCYILDINPKDYLEKIGFSITRKLKGNFT